MKSVKELSEALRSVLAVDSAQRKAVENLINVMPGPVTLESVVALSPIYDEQMASITQQNSAILREILNELEAHDSPEAVQATRRAFRSSEAPFRRMAIMSLSRMSTPAAAKALAKHASFWSFAEKEERDLARAMLQQRQSADWGGAGGGGTAGGRDPRAELAKLAKAVLAVPDSPDAMRQLPLNLLKIEAKLLEGLPDAAAETLDQKLSILASAEELVHSSAQMLGGEEPAVRMVRDMIPLVRGILKGRSAADGSARDGEPLGVFIRDHRYSEAAKAISAVLRFLMAQHPMAADEEIDIDLGAHLGAFEGLWMVLDKARTIQPGAAGAVEGFIEVFRGGAALAPEAESLARNYGRGRLSRRSLVVLLGLALNLKALDDRSASTGTGIRFVHVSLDSWIAFCEYLWERAYVDDEAIRSTLRAHKLSPPAPVR